jgi:hypothetical protein
VPAYTEVNCNRCTVPGLNIGPYTSYSDWGFSSIFSQLNYYRTPASRDQISARKMAILTEVFRGFPQFLCPNERR